jgi:hypothetical protein
MRKIFIPALVLFCTLTACKNYDSSGNGAAEEPAEDDPYKAGENNSGNNNNETYGSPSDSDTSGIDTINYLKNRSLEGKHD